MTPLTCSRCCSSYLAGSPGSNGAFCAPCMQTLERLSREAGEYQDAINRGDTSVKPTSEQDAQRLSRAVTRRRKRA